jgi:hypothetical protein
MDLQELIDREAVRETAIRLFVSTDRRDWTAVQDCFAPDVHFDMSSLTGEEPRTLPARDIVAAWETGLAPLEAVHHQVGNLLVDFPDEGGAHVTCHGIALHYLPNRSGENTRTFVGTYELHLDRDGGLWRIDRFRFRVKYVEGNLELERAGG